MGSTSSRPGSARIFVAVIGDIIASREIRDRWNFQQALAAGLKQLSTGSPSLLSPWTITLGDEFQALFADGAGLLGSLWKVQRLLYPSRARISLGIGRLDTPINPDAALGMDGPAFHLARSGMEALKRDEQRLFAVHEQEEQPSKVADVLNLAAAVVYGGRAGVRLQLLPDLLEGRSPQEIGGEDSSEVRRIQKLRREGGLAVVADALLNAEEEISALCRSKMPR